MGRRSTIWLMVGAMLMMGAISLEARGATDSAVGIVANLEGVRGSLFMVTDTVTSSAIDPGDEIPFFEDVAVLGIQVGSIVTFELNSGPPAVAVNLGLVSTGTVVTGAQSGNIIVGAGESALIRNGATIDGKISVKGGTLVIMDSSIDRKIESSPRGSIIIVLSSKIDGKIETQGGATLVVKNSVVDGKLSSTNDNYVRIADNTIKGKLEVLTAPKQGCKVSGNTVDGKTTIPAVCQ